MEDCSPDLRGLDEGQIDAVFSPMLISTRRLAPLLESYGFLSDQAPVITTRPTAALATHYSEIR